MRHPTALPWTSLPVHNHNNPSFRRRLATACSLEVSMQKIKRRWTSLVDSSWPGNGASNHSFKVLQWNILADGLAQNGDFIRAPKEALEWGNRWPLILSEVEESQADLVCMQEVNKYADFLHPAMHSRGYGSFFCPKSKSPAELYNKHPDGSVIFYKTDRFSLVDDPKGFSFQDNGRSMAQGGVVVHLHDQEANRTFVVATTHLKAKNGMDNTNLRVAQVSQLLSLLKALASGHEDNPSWAIEKDNENDFPVIVCGDFNDTPESWPCMGMSGSALGLQNLWDVDVFGDRETDLFTTYKYRSNGECRRIIDYIWFTRNGAWVPIKRWLMPDAHDIGDSGLPNSMYGSDHLSVCAEFEWI